MAAGIGPTLLKLNLRQPMTQQFDLFVSPDTAPAKTSGSAMKRHSPAVLSDEDMVRHIEGTGRYRILKKLELCSVSASSRPDFH